MCVCVFFFAVLAVKIKTYNHILEDTATIVKPIIYHNILFETYHNVQKFGA